MAEEIVDIFNENFEYLGTAPKSIVRKEGYWCQSIHTWIIRPEKPGYVLFQKRGSQKKIFPNALDISAAGHYKAGEQIADGVREIAEELNFSIKFDELIPLGIKLDVGKVGSNIVREFCHVFFLILDKNPVDYDVAEDEVEGLVEIAIPDGLKLFAGQEMTVEAIGKEFDPTTKTWQNTKLQVDKSLFIPRIDNYYYKIFILAERYLKGEKDLVI